MYDREKSLDELDPPAWGDPTFPSHLVTTCHQLRRKPLREFVVEDLRIMIGQHIGIPFLLPIAIEVIEREPLAEGDFYPGDLLVSVLSTDERLWTQHSDLAARVLAVLSRGHELPDEIRRAAVAFRQRVESNRD
jgi:hypothetical protein